MPNAPSRVDRLVELALDSQFYPISSVALKLALMLEQSSESVAGLTNLILSEVALTNQILRRVNTAAYRRDSWDGDVTTVSKALQLMGFDEVRRIALALELLRQRRVESRNGPYEKACLQSMRSVALIRQLVPRFNAERATITAMLRAAGTAACALVAPGQIDELRANGDDQLVAERLCRHWGLPEELTRLVSPPVLRAFKVAIGSDDYFRAISLHCHRLAGDWSAETGLTSAPMAALVSTLHALTGVTVEGIESAVLSSMQEADSAFAAALGRPPLDDVPVSPPAPADSAADSLDATLSAMLDQQVDVDRPPTRNELFIGAIADIQVGQSGGADPRALGRVLLESLHRAMSADLTVLYLVSRNLAVPYLGFGMSATELKSMGFPLVDPPPDLVQATIARRSDLLLNAMTVEQSNDYLPPWLRDWMAAKPALVQSLLVLPIDQGNTVQAVVLSVSAQAGPRVSREELMSLRLIKSQLMQLLRAAIATGRKA